MNIIEKKTELTLCEQPIGYAYEEVPELTAWDYRQRIQKLWNMEQTKAYDFIIIYGDREHFSNIYYFTGYDPRWEESLLILKRGARPILLVGNEGMGYVSQLQADVTVTMYQTLSLMGQPNDARSKKLTDIFCEAGVDVKSHIGLIGWKTYQKELFDLPELVTDVPYYIVETLAKIVGLEKIENATDVLTDCEYGLKHQVSAKEIVQFDVIGTKVSRGIYDCVKNLRPGMREIEAAEKIRFNGEPLNMHPNINFGKNHVAAGLNSPKYDVKLQYGMPMGAGYGMRGSLVHKCGMYIRDESDLPEEQKDYVKNFLKPYFACVIKWYEMMKIGTSCGDIYQMVEDMLGFEKFGIGLNPGHLTHTDEWTNSPFQKNSKVKIQSGMAFQCDFTVTSQKPFMSAHVEDGLVIADKALREEVKRIAPTCYQRIEARKQFICDVLNINLPEEVLPLSDLSCVCFPYMADISVVLAKE
ncbi:M24 family metallopeptidase [Parablautia sp. Marseille-Q6255]|uniref:M24 family metallopeptidase n=1 Tax=Parablautia sp. Marseille-Q6255 TaxID=3039593 RepID=UPI0024BD3721|nr:M24 family metallopeptidase [Parablautia sp. Marseille-Q6255]